MQTNKLIVLGVALFVIALGLLIIKFRGSKQGRKKMSVQLGEVRKLTHDTVIYTFVLPSSQKKLGLKVGEHIQIEQNIKGEIVKRKYTPISSIDKVGSFELLLKTYLPTEQFPNGGKMSSFLSTLPIHSKINITLPFGRFNYVGKSYTRISDFEGRAVQRKYKNFYMVAGGTGITPIFQIIQYCCDKESEQDRPGLYLLFANRTQDDILMKETLDRYAEKNYNIKVYYSVDRKITDNWDGMVGFVDEEKVKKSIPEDIKNTLFLSCGPPPLCNNVEKFWKILGVNNEQIFRF